MSDTSTKKFSTAGYKVKETDDEYTYSMYDNEW